MVTGKLGMSWSNVYISCVVVGITLALTFLLSKSPSVLISWEKLMHKAWA